MSRHKGFDVGFLRKGLSELVTEQFVLVCPNKWCRKELSKLDVCMQTFIGPYLDGLHPPTPSCDELNLTYHV